MEIVIENIPNLNAPAPAPEDTVAAEALVTNIDRLADESPNEAAPAVPVATVPAAATEGTEAATAATSAATESRAAQATSRPATYMPFTSADEDGASKPIFLSRIRPGFWDLPEIAFD